MPNVNEPTKGEGEYGVKFNEPTTGEIVRALRVYSENLTCDCRVCTKKGCIAETVKSAIDRLESQERELSGITGELERFRAFHERYAEQTSKQYVVAVCGLTARAEQAEAREKAVLEDMKDYCQFCWHCDKNDDEEPCKTCENVTHDGSETKWTWRGLPQDGEGL